MLLAFVEQRGGGLAVIGARSFGERGVIGTDSAASSASRPAAQAP